MVAVWVADNERAHESAVVSVWRFLDHCVRSLSPLPRWIEILNHEPEEKPVLCIALFRM